MKRKDLHGSDISLRGCAGFPNNRSVFHPDLLSHASIGTYARDADYKLILIAGCCADRDAELHEALIKKLFPTRAEVLTADEFVHAAKPAGD